MGWRVFMCGYRCDRHLALAHSTETHKTLAYGSVRGSAAVEGMWHMRCCVWCVCCHTCGLETVVRASTCL